MKITIKENRPSSVVEVRSVGPAGRDGEKGEKGDKGDLLHFDYVQSVPSDEWVIHHYLNVFPSVTIVDSAGSTVYGEVKYLSRNHLKVCFSAAFAGSAYLN